MNRTAETALTALLPRMIEWAETQERYLLAHGDALNHRWMEIGRRAGVAIKGYGGDEHKELSRAANFNAHLLKPITPRGVRANAASLMRILTQDNVRRRGIRQRLPDRIRNLFAKVSTTLRCRYPEGNGEIVG